MKSDEWIIVPNWERFQSRNLVSRPNWIRNYPGALLHKAEYLDLTLTERGLLHGIWLAYAEANGRLRKRDLASAIGRPRVLQRTLDSLLAKGFIQFSTGQPSPLFSIERDARARDEPPSDPDEIAARRRGRAEAWIASGVAAEVPDSHLARVIAEEFRLREHPEIVADLVARAMEMR